MCFSMSVWTDALKRVLLCEKTGKWQTSNLLLVIDVKNMFFWFQLLVYTVYSLVSLKSGATDS